MVNAITTPTIESVVASLQLADKFHVTDYGMQIRGTPSIDASNDWGGCGCFSDAD